jgi:hypothetical protein
VFIPKSLLVQAVAVYSDDFGACSVYLPAVQVWEGIKASTNMCMIHGDFRISS